MSTPGTAYTCPKCYGHRTEERTLATRACLGCRHQGPKMDFCTAISPERRAEITRIAGPILDPLNGLNEASTPEERLAAAQEALRRLFQPGSK